MRASRRRGGAGFLEGREKCEGCPTCFGRKRREEVGGGVRLRSVGTDLIPPLQKREAESSRLSPLPSPLSQPNPLQSHPLKQRYSREVKEEGNNLHIYLKNPEKFKII
jgi:hypothetical protein